MNDSGRFPIIVVVPGALGGLSDILGPAGSEFAAERVLLSSVTSIRHKTNPTLFYRTIISIGKCILFHFFGNPKGNSALLNPRLMERARLGTGVVSPKKLRVGIVGAGLAGMVAAMDLADAGHDVRMT